MIEGGTACSARGLAEGKFPHRQRCRGGNDGKGGRERTWISGLSLDEGGSAGTILRSRRQEALVESSGMRRTAARH
jgi:hypothetical protein